MPEADKFTLVQEITARIPYSILTLMEYKGNYCLNNSQIAYQSMLCENPLIRPEIVKTLNPFTLLPVDSGPPEHDCLEVMDEVFSSQPDLTDQSFGNLDIEYFTDGISFVWDSMRFAVYAVVTLDSVIEAHPLPWNFCTKDRTCRPHMVTPAHCSSMGKHLH
jgi:hypothetical protein